MIESDDNISRGVGEGDNPGLRKLETGAINETCVPRTVEKSLPWVHLPIVCFLSRLTLAHIPTRWLNMITTPAKIS